jgi:CheY-like chemotaxis protein
MREVGHGPQAVDAWDGLNLKFRHLLDKLPAAAYTCDAEGSSPISTKRRFKSGGESQSSTIRWTATEARFGCSCHAVETSRPLVEEKGHRITVTLPPKPVYVYGDRDRLAQVFSNLLNNSAKYTGPGGHISLTVEQHGSDVVVSVKDDGVGIPEDKLGAIFEMFTQVDQKLERSPGGLGIGLNLVRGLVEMHGGTVQVQSGGPGKGSEFTVRLPVLLSPNMVQQRSTEDGNDTNPSSAHRILVVDDNNDGAKSLALLLQAMGHDARTVHDGLEAVEAAAEFRPEVVLLDIGLPRLNGYEVARRIRAQPWSASMVLIAQTGWGQEEDQRRSKEAGFNFHLVKPVDPTDLEKLLAGLLLTPP